MVYNVQAEHEGGKVIAASAAVEIRTRCEVRASVKLLSPGTLPKNEFKAKRVCDERW